MRINHFVESGGRRRWSALAVCSILFVSIIIDWEKARSSLMFLSMIGKTTTATTRRHPAVQFVLDRENVYKQQGKLFTWAMRGIGRLYQAHGIVLSAELPVSPKKGPQTITIHNVLENNSLRNDCHLLTIWVRVNGPEVFAGSALPVPATKRRSCYWEFHYDLREPGTYSVDAKVLVWNSHAAVEYTEESSQCKVVHSNDTSTLTQTYPLHRGFLGFKLYHAAQSCCEICSRLAPYCQYWSSPPLLETQPKKQRNGCELYFSQDTPADLLPESSFLTNNHSSDKISSVQTATDVPYVQGFPHNKETAHFLGCGWNPLFTLDFPCLSGELDDQVFMSKREFTLPPTATSDDSVSTNTRKPLCTKDTFDLNGTTGRWVRKKLPPSCSGKLEMDPDYKKKFDIVQFDGMHPQCWHRDDLSRIGWRCIEMNCNQLKKSAKWVSSLHNESDWFGVWRNDDCDYVEFTNEQLQKCVNQHRITSVETSGVSISAFTNEYVNVRFKNITFVNSTENDSSLRVIIDTLKAPHRMWSADDDEWVDTFRNMPNVTPNTEHFWMTSFYLSSEREPHIHVGRSEKFIETATKFLEPKGYKMINAFDLTKAFTYDTATQFDGLHIIGPPMKMIVTKVLHYLCADVVQGSVV